MPKYNSDQTTRDARALMYARLEAAALPAHEIAELLGLKHVSSLHSIRKHAAEMGYITEARKKNTRPHV
jgi:hypothetical protein